MVLYDVMSFPGAVFTGIQALDAMFDYTLYISIPLDPVY